MSTVANIYDNGPISPIVKIHENLSVWTSQKWSHYKVLFIEPLPRSSQSMIEMITLGGVVTVLGALGALARQIIPALQLADGDFTHLRFEPIDDVEGIVWEQASQGRFVTRGFQARATRYSSIRDPYLAGSTFWILGRDRDVQLEVRNPQPVQISQARFVFWGYRYVLEPLTSEPSNTCYVPAEGRQ